MNEFSLLVGCVLVALCYLGILLLSKTLLFGFNVLNVFSIASGTLSAFVLGSLFGVDMDWVSVDHTTVLTYSIAGLIAMAFGIYLAWRPLSEAARDLPPLKVYVPKPVHFNEDLGWLTFWTGASAEILYALVSKVPTLSTAVYCLSALDRIGLCILLVAALKSRSYSRFLIAFVVFGVISVIGSLASGFTFIRINALVPLFVIWLVASGINFRTVSVSLLLATTATVLVSAWLETREIIRSGSLEGLAFLERVQTFFTAFFESISIPSVELAMNTVRARVDMTDILALQVSFQPTHEPYAFGDTVFTSLYTLIPRFVWAEKPEVAGGSAFVTRFTGIARGINDDTSVGLPYPFELYANGGPILVIVGLGIIGYVCGRLELKLMRTPSSLGGFWAMALVTAVLCEGGQRTDVVLPALVASGISAYVLGWIIQRFWKNGLLSGAVVPPTTKPPGLAAS